MFGENYKADISDLQLEQWLRRRNAGLLVWQTKDGTEIPVKDMTDSHMRMLSLIWKKHKQEKMLTLKDYRVMTNVI